MENQVTMSEVEQQECTREFDELVQKLVDVVQKHCHKNECETWNAMSDFLGGLLMQDELVLKLVAYGKIAD